MGWKNKSVLVTGHNGLVGTNLVNKLEDLGALVNKAEQKDNKERLDLTKKENCEYLFKNNYDCVFHCAAKSFGAKYMKEHPEGLIEPNILMNMNMLESAVDHTDKFVFISSSTIYPDLDIPMKETDDGEPAKVYQGVGNMKKYSEKLCEFYKDNKGLETIIIRPSNIYGPHDKYETQDSHVIPALIKKALNKDSPFIVWGDGNQVRDFIYVDDFINMTLEAVEKNISPINIATGYGQNMRYLTDLVLKETNHNLKPTYDLTKPTAIPIRLVNNKKALKLLKNKPKIDLKEGIKRTTKWMKEDMSMQ